MTDLFTFTLSQYIQRRNVYLKAEYPYLTEELNQQNDRINAGQSNFDMTKENFNKLSPAEQLRALGIKSAAKQQVLTPEQEYAKTKSKHAEANLQIKFGLWVKKWYPDDRFVTHKREGIRNGFNRAAFKSLNNSEGHPDWEAIIFCEGFTGLLIEFKRPCEDWLLKDNKTVKTAYSNQYRCHLDLWKVGKAVYFCNDFANAREIYKAYKSGSPLPQQIYSLKK